MPTPYVERKPSPRRIFECGDRSPYLGRLPSSTSVLLCANALG